MDNRNATFLWHYTLKIKVHIDKETLWYLLILLYQILKLEQIFIYTKKNGKKIVTKKSEIIGKHEQWMYSDAKYLNEYICLSTYPPTRKVHKEQVFHYQFLFECLFWKLN